MRTNRLAMTLLGAGVAIAIGTGLGGCAAQSEGPEANKSSQATTGADTSETIIMASSDVARAPQPGRSHDHSMAAEVMEKSTQRIQAPVAYAESAMSGPRPAPHFLPHPLPEEMDREQYPEFDDNGIRRAAEAPVSTFSVDVDTASYSNVRRLLDAGRLPGPDTVRTEELINYFTYNYRAPESAREPFSVYTEVGPSPWHENRKLLHIGLQGYREPMDEAPPMNLVFLIDVSGSMQSADKLPLLKRGLGMLMKQMRPTDRVALVVYAGAAGVVLEPTQVSERATIENALSNLRAGGSTNGGAGIRRAYGLARQGFIDGGVNRVVLATDGDFNVGTTGVDDLRQLVETEARSGVTLSILGFGQGNYNDTLMQELAQNGNGNAAYIDSIHEARKVFVEDLVATLVTIARDVKIQVEFNPAVVAEYRLIGYETRALQREDFNNDQVDAGDIGAGHSVTALYELALVGSGGEAIDQLRYGSFNGGPHPNADLSQHSGEIAEVRIRFKRPERALGGVENEVSELMSHRVRLDQMRGDASDVSADFQFSAAVAAFGQRLRGSTQINTFDWSQIEQLAAGARGDDLSGYRSEFLKLVRTAEALN